MEEFISTHISTYGPIAVFVLLMLSGIGLSVAEDVIIIPAGFLVGTGQLELGSTLLASYSGVVLSDLLWFHLCRHYGTPMLHKKWFKRMLHPRRLLEAKHQMEERGAWVIVMARFIPGSRTTAITVAGLLHMPLIKFALVTVGCVLITSPLQLGLGYLVARGMSDGDTPDVVMRSIGLVMLLVGLVTAVRWWRARHRAGPRPRAKAKWLRRFRVPTWRRGRDTATVIPMKKPPAPHPDS